MQGSALPEGCGGEVAPTSSTSSLVLLLFSVFTGESAGRARGGAYHAPAGCGAAQAPHHHFYLFPFLSFPHAILKRRGLEDGEDNVGLGTIVSREIFPYGCD